MCRLQVHLVEITTLLLLLAPTTLCFCCFANRSRTGTSNRRRNIPMAKTIPEFEFKFKFKSTHPESQSKSKSNSKSMQSSLTSMYSQRRSMDYIEKRKQQEPTATDTTTTTATPPNENTINANSKANNNNNKSNKIIQTLQKSFQQLNYGGELWFLTAMAILSGLSPAVDIISSSHVSRLPDNPIAHDIDTLLLWPATTTATAETTATTTATTAATVSATTVFPPTIFQAPFAAITDESMYDVDWTNVLHAYMSNVELSFLCAFVISTSLVLFVDD